MEAAERRLSIPFPRRIAGPHSNSVGVATGPLACDGKRSSAAESPDFVAERPGGLTAPGARA